MEMEMEMEIVKGNASFLLPSFFSLPFFQKDEQSWNYCLNFIEDNFFKC
jgi:hypothetical protein